MQTDAVVLIGQGTTFFDNLPCDLKVLVQRAFDEPLSFEGSDVSLACLTGWLARGDFDTARVSASRIIEQEASCRRVRELGLPADLQALVDDIERGRIEYPERAADLGRLQGWIAKGELSIARTCAVGIVKRQAELKNMQAVGLPADLLNMIEVIDQSEITYPERGAMSARLHNWIGKGELEIARFLGQSILSRDRALALAARHGMPHDLQDLIERAQAADLDHPDQSAAMARLTTCLENGDHPLAFTIAKGIIGRQSALTQASIHGLPSDLRAMLEQIEAEAMAYLGRPADMERLQRWIGAGETDLARVCARQIVASQRNLASAGAAGRAALA